MSFFVRSVEESRRTAALAAPIVSGLLGQMAMGWADAVMVGRVGVTALAACAFGNTVIAVPLVFGFGLLAAVSVKASHAFGATDNFLCGETLRAGLLLALGAGLLMAAAIIAGTPFLGVFRQPPEVTAASGSYIVLCAISIIFVFLSTVMKNFCEAMGRPWAPFWLMIASVLLNVALNWVFIYGNLGSPALGLAGAALATLISRIVLCAATLLYLVRSTYMRPMMPVAWFAGGLRGHFPSLLKIGLPGGGMSLCEVSGFALGSIMMGWVGVNALAAHQVAMTCAGTAFMIPLGLAQAVSVRVGQARGALKFHNCRPIVMGTLGLSVVIMASTAMIFVLGGRSIAALFVPDGTIVALAAQLLLLAGVFQLFDGVQVVCAGSLRGFEDTRVPMLIGILAYWVIALPVSYFSAFHLELGAPGVWIGYVIGLFAAATLLGLRVLRQLRRVETACPAG